MCVILPGRSKNPPIGSLELQNSEFLSLAVSEGNTEEALQFAARSLLHDEQVLTCIMQYVDNDVWSYIHPPTALLEPRSSFCLCWNAQKACVVSH